MYSFDLENSSITDDAGNPLFELYLYDMNVS